MSQLRIDADSFRVGDEFEVDSDGNLVARNIRAEHIDADVRNVAVVSTTATTVAGSSVVTISLDQSISGWGELLCLVGDLRPTATFWFTTSFPVAALPVYQVGTNSNVKMIVFNNNGDARNIQIWRSANYRTLYMQRETPHDTTHTISRIVAVRDPSTAPPPPVLADAVAPTLTIATVASVNELQTQTLTASVSGGTYDTLEYDWVVVSLSGGTITGIGASVTYTAPDVAADTEVTVQCEVIARGTGGNALDSTSDSDTDLETFTVNFVDPATLPVTVAPVVTIGAIASVDEDETQALIASVPHFSAMDGGTYDTLEYEWAIIIGSGTITGTGASVTYKPAERIGQHLRQG